MEAIVKWTGGMQFVGKSDTGHAVVMDVGTQAGGTNSAITPFEMLLVSIGGCTGMDIVLILKKMKADFTGLEIKINALRSDEHPRKLVRAELEYIVRGKGVTEEQVRRAVELSHEKYCSVSATLRPGVEISSKVTIL
jgi:putative redox protein